MFGRVAVASFLALWLSAPAAQAQIIASYYAEIGPEDRRNSRGVALTDVGAIIQQDRANYHRFGIRHAGDDGDGLFGSRDMRARIPELYGRGARFGPLETAILDARFNMGIVVFICGSGGVPSSINVDYADGDGHIGC